MQERYRIRTSGKGRGSHARRPYGKWRAGRVGPARHQSVPGMFRRYPRVGRSLFARKRDRFGRRLPGTRRGDRRARLSSQPFVAATVGAACLPTVRKIAGTCLSAPERFRGSLSPGSGTGPAGRYVPNGNFRECISLFLHVYRRPHRGRDTIRWGKLSRGRSFRQPRSMSLPSFSFVGPQGRDCRSTSLCAAYAGRGDGTVLRFGSAVPF